jgi:hypothetical protein
MYDPEAWSFTPTREQRRPIHFMKRFSLRARTAGYQVVLAPSPNLTDLARGSCRRRIGESKTSAYVRCRMAARIALYADVLDLQAQGLERAPGRYRSFFATAARQAREANRRISIISQLSSAPADRSVPPVILERAYRAVKGLGDGYYLYVDPMNPSGAARFLEWVSS